MGVDCIGTIAVAVTFAFEILAIEVALEDAAMVDLAPDRPPLMPGMVSASLMMEPPLEQLLLSLSEARRLSVKYKSSPLSRSCR